VKRVGRSNGSNYHSTTSPTSNNRLQSVCLLNYKTVNRPIDQGTKESTDSRATRFASLCLALPIFRLAFAVPPKVERPCLALAQSQF